MDLMKTMLVYMAVVLSSTLGSAPAPTATPAPTPAPAAIVIPAPKASAPQPETQPPEAETKPPEAHPSAAQTKAPTPTPTAKPAPTSRPTASPKPTAAPTPALTPDAAYDTLRPGERGDAVKKMQQRLKELGYYKGEVDGVFGKQTKGAVMRFQRSNGLDRDGIAGKRTLTVLYQYEGVIAAATPTPEPLSAPAVAPAADPTAEEPAPESPILPPASQSLSQTSSGPFFATTLAVLADGRVLVEGAPLEAPNLLGLSAEMDVLMDVAGFGRAMGWNVIPAREGLGFDMDAGGHRLAVSYTLAGSGELDWVNLACDGEAVELTEAMTALSGGRLFLAPGWLEAMGAAVQWDLETLTLAVGMGSGR